jgi:hypothetical protein
VNGRDLNGAPATQSPKPKYVLLVLFDMRGFILHDGQAFHPSLTLKIVTHWFIALTGRNAMRLILATATVALAISAATSTAVFAQKKNTDEAKASRAQARESINDSFNRCVSLAKSRGYTSSDLDGNRAAARNFVMSCMQGKQR